MHPKVSINFNCWYCCNFNYWSQIPKNPQPKNCQGDKRNRSTSWEFSFSWDWPWQSKLTLGSLSDWSMRSANEIPAIRNKEKNWDEDFKCLLFVHWLNNQLSACFYDFRLKISLSGSDNMFYLKSLFIFNIPFKIFSVGHDFFTFYQCILNWA
jgi:hypothetical protein